MHIYILHIHLQYAHKTIYIYIHYTPIYLCNVHVSYILVSSDPSNRRPILVFEAPVLIVPVEWTDGQVVDGAVVQL